MPRRTACVAVALLTGIALAGAGCTAARQQPTPGSVAPTHAADVDPTATTLPDAPPTNVDHGPSLSPSPPLPTFEFVRWRTTELTLVTEPGGDVGVEGTNDEPIAAVLDRTMHEGVEWIRVQVGRGYAQDYTVNGWAPKVADVEVDGEMVHIDPVYEPTTITCPDRPPTVSDLDAMLPAQALACYGSRTLTFSPVWVVAHGSEDDHTATGDPEWLAIRNDLVMYDSQGWQLTGSITIHIDPASGIEVTPERWVELEGRFDHPAANSCTRSSEIEEFDLANQDEVELWCRERFVVTAARLVPEEEQPTPPPRPTPGPPATETIAVTTERIRAPIPGRIDASGVWTGKELIVWSGAEFPSFLEGASLRPGGAAYDPSRDRWRMIADAPLEPRAGALATWTGREMLIWGGHYSGQRHGPTGAAYDPVADTWRRIAPGPLPTSPKPGATWTGTEWVIAANTRDDRMEIAAYDPEADMWRSLPPLPGSWDSETYLVWTGTEVVLRNSTTGMYRIEPDADAWTPIPQADEEPGINGPLVWTGRLVIGQTYANLSTEVGGWDPWSYLTAWDPASDKKVQLPLPPGDVSPYFVWTGEHLIPLGSGLAFHPASGSWANLPTPAAADRDDAVVAWTGDRLIVWGGPGSRATSVDAGIVLIPEW